MDHSRRILCVAMIIFVLASVFGLKELDEVLSQSKQDECREESNFRGELSPQGVQNITQELKCFAACSLIKLGIMDDKDGTVDTVKLDELIANHTGGKDASDMFKTTVVEPCMKEVKKSTDDCEYSYQLIVCGMDKIKPPPAR